MSVMMARAAARRARERDTGEDLVDTITEVVTQLLPELMVAALADPAVRAELHKVLARSQRAGTPPPARRAAEVKAARGRR
jgi:hypothetical protein